MRFKLARNVLDVELRMCGLRIGMFLRGRPAPPFPRLCGTMNTSGAFGEVMLCSEDAAYALHVAYPNRAICPIYPELRMFSI